MLHQSEGNDPLSATLAVLAGGAGRRMGMPKSLLRIQERPILEFLLDQWNWPGPTLLVTSPAREHPPGHERFSREVVDAVAGEGPLRGILTALENCSTPLLVVTTCDAPNLRREHFQWLLEQLERNQSHVGVMMRCKNRIEPLPLVLRAHARQLITERIIDGQRSVHALSGLPQFTIVDVPADWSESTWMNLNTPEDLEHL